jgi:hypothetical protein
MEVLADNMGFQQEMDTMNVEQETEQQNENVFDSMFEQNNQDEQNANPTVDLTQDEDDNSFKPVPAPPTEQTANASATNNADEETNGNNISTNHNDSLNNTNNNDDENNNNSNANNESTEKRSSSRRRRSRSKYLFVNKYSKINGYIPHWIFFSSYFYLLYLMNSKNI